MIGYQIAVLLHIIAAVTWFGGMLFLVMVMVPLARREMEATDGAQLLARVGRRFRPVSWASIVILVVTGLYLATDHWDVSVSDFFGGDTYFISILQVKVGLALIAIVLSAVHDFVLGPRVSRQLEALQDWNASPEGLRKSRRALLMLARLNMLLVLAIIGLAVTMTRGNPF